MGTLDWSFVAIYFIFALSIGLYFTKRAGKDITEFITSGKSLPWWLAGTSMVATAFAADTPLAVTELVIPVYYILFFIGEEIGNRGCVSPAETVAKGILETAYHQK